MNRNISCWMWLCKVTERPLTRKDQSFSYVKYILYVFCTKFIKWIGFFYFKHDFWRMNFIHLLFLNKLAIWKYISFPIVKSILCLNYGLHNRIWEVHFVKFTQLPEIIDMFFLIWKFLLYIVSLLVADIFLTSRSRHTRCRRLLFNLSEWYDCPHFKWLPSIRGKYVLAQDFVLLEWKAEQEGFEIFPTYDYDFQGSMIRNARLSKWRNDQQ